MLESANSLQELVDSSGDSSTNSSAETLGMDLQFVCLGVSLLTPILLGKMWTTPDVSCMKEI